MIIEIGKPDKYLNLLYWFRFRPGLNGINCFFFYVDFLARYDVAWEVNFFLMKTTLFQFNKQAVVLKFFDDLLNNFHIILACILDVNLGVIEVYDDENIKFLR